MPQVQTQNTTEDKVMAKTATNPRLKWDLKSCKADAKRFKSRTEWQTLSSGAYNSAHSNGWLDVCCKHMPKPQNQKTKTEWTLEDCKEEAISFKTIAEWNVNSSRGYYTAFVNGWIPELKAYLEDDSVKWSFAACRKTAEAFGFNREAWRLGDDESYEVALSRGWIEEICK